MTRRGSPEVIREAKDEDAKEDESRGEVVGEEVVGEEVGVVTA